MHSVRWILIALAAASAVLYLIGVPRVPAGFSIDESSIAYNASTVARTGADEFGIPWPLYFRAFDDHKNPTYVYLLAALFRLLGPSITLARLLSAAAGILCAAMLGLLATQLTRDKRAGWMTASLALLTPWLFETSRVVLEVAIYPLTLTLFLLAVHAVSTKQKWSRLDSITIAATLALLTYTYTIGRLLAPLLAVSLAFFLNRERWRSIVRTWFFYGITVCPLVIYNDIHPGALTGRFKAVTYVTRDSAPARVLVEFFGHLARNFNPWRLLVTGDPNPFQLTHLYGAPLFLLGTFVFVVAGMVFVARNEARTAWGRFIFYGVAVAVVPATLTKDEFHMLRLIPLPVFLLVFAGVGLGWFLRTLRLPTVILFALALGQAAVFQWNFHRTARDSWRRHLFDADYRDRIFKPAIKSELRPIYLADMPSIPGYIQAYWYATLARIDLANFVRIAPDEDPPEHALVITTDDSCGRCDVIEAIDPYTLYITNGPRRARVPLPENGFRAQLSVVEPLPKLRAGEQALLRVKVKNVSAATWMARERIYGKLQVSLGNHWLTPEGKTVANDDGRAALTRDLPPGAETDLSLKVNAPPTAGDYILELDMLQEGVSWFALKGSPTVRVKARVE